MDATNTNSEESSIRFTANNNVMRNGQITPPLFPSVPALNGAASYLAETTSYLTSCFPATSDIATRSSDGQEVMALNELKEPLLINNAPPVRDEITRNSEDIHSQTDTAIVQSDQTNQSGISMFQSYISVILSGFEGQFMGHLMTLDGYNVLQGCLLLKTGLSGLIIFSTISGTVYMFCQTQWYIYWFQGDLQSLEDLTYEKRKEFLKKHQLPKELPVVSFHTEASISPAVLATLSRVAHAELPTFAANSTATVLPVVVPLGATLAACAQLLQTRYGEKSDGLVTCRDAEVPGLIVVHPKRKLDHAWMVYSSTNDDPLEPDASQVCEALLTLVMEVGLRKKQYLNVKHE